MIKKILNLETAQKITEIEQKSINEEIPECWVFAIEAGCHLISFSETCPLDTAAGICESNQVCC